MSAEDRERWEARWSGRADAGPGGPEPYLVREAADLPPGARVLDAAAGDGRNALWLAARGFAVAAVDVAPSAVARLERAAVARGGLRVDARVADLDEAGALAGLGPFDVLTVVRFRPSPPQWRRLVGALSPGGRLLLCSFGAEQHRRRGFPLAFCLDRASLERELSPALRLLRWESRREGGDFLEGSAWERPRDG